MHLIFFSAEQALFSEQAMHRFAVDAIVVFCYMCAFSLQDVRRCFFAPRHYSIVPYT